jgi:hypothetical protein
MQKSVRKVAMAFLSSASVRIVPNDLGGGPNSRQMLSDLSAHQEQWLCHGANGTADVAQLA